MKPLQEVWQDVVKNARELDGYDDRISQGIQTIEDQLRQRNVRRVISVKLPDGAELGWSARRGAWRLVIRDNDEIVPLLSASRDERAEVFTCGAMAKLVERALNP